MLADSLQKPAITTAARGAATGGAITPGEVADLARMAEIFLPAAETSNFERRLEQLEARCGAGA